MSSHTSAFLRLMMLGLAVAAASTAHAEEAWRVSRASGDVWKLSAGGPARLTPGAMLAAGESVRTGANGRLLLARGTETMLLGANTAIDLAPEAPSGMTTVLQQAGSLALDIEHKDAPHFEVETPYLVAAVKGTQFRVTVRRKGAEVNVTRGLVQVSSPTSGEAVGVAPGQHATVAAANGRLALAGPGPHAALEHVEARGARVEAITVPASGLVSPFRSRRAHAAPHRRRAEGASVPAKAMQAPGDSSGSLQPGETDEARRQRIIWSRGDVRRAAPRTAPPEPVRDARPE